MKNWIKRILTLIKYRKQTLSIGAKSEISLCNHYEGCNAIGKNTIFHGDIGFGSYIGSSSVISAQIGRFTSISSQVITESGTHPYTYPYASTSPIFYSTLKQCGESWSDKQYFDEFRCYDSAGHSVKIGNDCWIGERALIVGGVEIGNGAVVLANSVVTKDVPPYAIVGGVPAKIIKYRYSQEDIEFLTNLKWWDKSISEIKNIAHLIRDIDALKRHFE